MEHAQDWAGNHICQMIDTGCPGDPASDYALNFQNILRDLNYETAIFTLNIIPGVRPEDFRSMTGADAVTFQPDDILLYHVTPNSKASPDYRRLPCHKVLVWHGSVPADLVKKVDPMRAALAKRTAREVSWLIPGTERVIADSQPAARQIQELGFTCPVTVIPPLIRFKDFDLSQAGTLREADEKRSLFLAVGDIVPERRIGDLIRVFAAYRSRYDSQAKLILAGRVNEMGSYYLSLLEYAEKLGLLPDALLFAGRLAKSELLAYYAHAALYLDMSAYEEFPEPLFGAMFAQTPVLASDSALHDWVLGKDRFVLPAGDPELAAGLMHRVVTDQVLAKSMVIHAKERLADFAPAGQFQTFVSLTGELIEKSGALMTKMKKRKES